MSARKRNSPYRLLPATPADLDEILEIEHASFSHPWSRQVFVEELKHPFSRLHVLRHADSSRMLAFINYWIVEDELHILNVATHPDWRRRGLAEHLIRGAVETGASRGVRLLTLEVRRSNRAAQRLYEKLGFTRVAVRPRYYQNGEDALIMNAELDPESGELPI